ncbi:MAG: aromatic amino acid lyase, partial [Gemmatimonadaceae bacterium]
MTPSAPVQLDGNSLTLDGVVAVAVNRAPVELAPAARTRMERAHEVVSTIVRRNAVAYGVTTGFGKLSDVAIPPERIEELQVNLVRSHAAGVGALLNEREARAMMLLRANVIAKGFSGARPLLVELLAGMLNAGLYPPIPEQGSVGASGDLAPLAHLALALIGEGELFLGAERGEASAMLARQGLLPVRLGP